MLGEVTYHSLRSEELPRVLKCECGRVPVIAKDGFGKRLGCQACNRWSSYYNTFGRLANSWNDHVKDFEKLCRK